MFSEKTYHLICHACGKLHEQRAMFLSVPQSFGVGLPGTNVTLCLPMLSCQPCRAIKVENPDEHPIRKAYLHGMSPAARMRAKQEVIERFIAEGEFWNNQP